GPAAALWTDLWRSPTDLCTADRNLCTALGTTNYSTVVRGNPLSATDPRDTNDSRPSSEERFGTLRWTTSPTCRERCPRRCTLTGALRGTRQPWHGSGGPSGSGGHRVPPGGHPE